MPFGRNGTPYLLEVRRRSHEASHIISQDPNPCAEIVMSPAETSSDEGPDLNRPPLRAWCTSSCCRMVEAPTSC